jgi:hypothetical protein
VSLIAIPDLPLSALRTLKVPHNNLTHLSEKISTTLQDLDLSFNNFSGIPAEFMTMYFPHLKSLSLSSNPITSIPDKTFQRLSNSLEHLDIANLDLESFSLDLLEALQNLRSLKTSAYVKLPNYNIPKLVQNLHNLRSIWIDSPPPPPPAKEPNGKPPKPSPPQSDLRREMEGIFPLKVRELTFSGKGLSKLADNIMSGIQSTVLHINFVNTSLLQLSPNLFKVMDQVRNVSMEIDGMNGLLKNIPNPNSAHILHLPNTVFLTDLKISGNSYTCDCELG